MKKRSFIVFFTLVLTVYFVLNSYIFIRGYHALPDLPYLKLIYSIILAVLSVSYIAGRFLERKFYNSFIRDMVWMGAIWLGAMVYFLIILIVFDVFSAINKLFNFIPIEDYISPEVKLTAFILTTLIVAVIVTGGFFNAKKVRVKKYNFKINKKGGKHKKIRIAAASDIHLGTIVTKDRLQNIVDILNNDEADIVLLVGDVIDEDIKPVINENLGDLIRNIRSKYGVYSITGNHEYIGGAEAACEYLKEHNVKILRDECILIDESIYVAGREDRSIKYFAHKKRKRLEDILNGMNKELPVILMDHQPLNFNDAVDNNIDIQLSGHTHHGQLWPFNYITSHMYEISMGYKKINNTHIYVSCGAGTWGPPIRTGNSPEILYIDLNIN